MSNDETRPEDTGDTLPASQTPGPAGFDPAAEAPALDAGDTDPDALAGDLTDGDVDVDALLGEPEGEDR